MKIIHLSNADSGGAGRASYRIHRSLIGFGLNSEMWVNTSNTNDSSVKSPKGIIRKPINFIRRNVKKPLTFFLKTKNSILHSPSLLSSSWVKKINESNADIINLHWIQHEMLSISDISKIKKPLIWTLHDMWGFCGAEHISWDDRWKIGYNNNNRPIHESGFDLNKWTWLRKIKHWKKQIQIITPSNWLAECVQQSKIMQNWPCKIIPNVIDTEFWKPVDKNFSRKELNLPQNELILAFGTYNANLEHHKGLDLLVDALKKIKNENLIKFHLIVFGQKNSQKKIFLDIPTHYMGILDDNKLRKLYSAVDAIVVPSRIESFGQTACEANACETPVISFDTSGLKDIIQHQITGYLAKKFDTKDLSEGIKWVLGNSKIKKLGFNARKHIMNNFNNDLVAKKYFKTYEEVLK